ncbi:hypothetical protein [Variovorax ginsengisoli]|uniref:Uncharacterized protein n=1 Tax=Variovorax ginsengisoli TaxID=363844 RepID=A0ABT8RZ32_9BURK|nr:hypothetical protein [Variovorax ginsengisoli]MDN8612756.1 hypothetical protein [Variovorax ginsengisoli]MDO1531926.1 hypothetical protein [Variovorax ginsengisoli]
MNIRAVVAAAIFAAVPAAHAQWNQEPTSVMGVTLGAPAASIPMCPPLVQSNPDSYKTPSFICTDDIGYSPQTASLKGIPFGFSRGGSVFFTNGAIASVHLLTGQVDYPRLKGMLVERYGPPMKTWTSQVTTTAGAVVSSEESTWSGPNVTILLSERARRADLSRAAFAFNALTAQAGADRAGENKANAGKL